METGVDLDSAFVQAADAVRQFANVDTSTMLRLYGLYKQSTVGVCRTAKPGLFNFAGRQKWEAWHSLGTASADECKRRYIELVNTLAPQELSTDGVGVAPKEKSSAFGVSVSCMAKTERELDDGDKTVYDWLKEGNVDKVAFILEADPGLVDVRDENGMALIHWAADRGDTAMIGCLAGIGADVNVTDADGQTPLHYAFACGHDECVRLLESLGADRHRRDGNGILPSELSDS